MYYDLEQLTKALAHATGYVVEINNLCRQLKDHADFGIICDGAVAEITHLMTDIQRKYKFLNPNYRSKRALLNVIGTISKSLFGTLNEDDAKFYDKQIELSKTNEKHLLSLIQKQTILLKTTKNVFSKSEQAIENQMLAINLKIENAKHIINTLVNTTQDQKVFLEIESLTSIVTLIIIRYQNTLNDILDLVSDVKHGKPHPAIISPDQIKPALAQIKQEIPNGMRLPFVANDENILYLYHQRS